MKNHSSVELPDLIEHLILYSGTVNDIGLYYGRAGIALSLYTYSALPGCSIYYGLATEILQECLDSLSSKTENSFDTGVAGIGWVIIHLCNRGIIHEDVSEILTELDLKIMESNLTRVRDMSFDSGLRGLAFYVWNRIHSSEQCGFDLDYLYEWRNLLSEINRGTCPNEIDINNIDAWLRCFHADVACSNSNELMPNVLYSSLSDLNGRQLISFPMGIKSGIAGYAIYLMNTL